MSGVLLTVALAVATIVGLLVFLPPAMAVWFYLVNRSLKPITSPYNRWVDYWIEKEQEWKKNQ